MDLTRLGWLARSSPNPASPDDLCFGVPQFNLMFKPKPGGYTKGEHHSRSIQKRTNANNGQVFDNMRKFRVADVQSAFAVPPCVIQRLRDAGRSAERWGRDANVTFLHESSIMGEQLGQLENGQDAKCSLASLPLITDLAPSPSF